MLALLCLNNTGMLSMALPSEATQLIVLQAQAAALRRVGQGGLNEAAGEGDVAAVGGPSSSAAPPGFRDDGPRRGDTLVSETEVQRQPSEAEQAIRLAVSQLRNIRGLSNPVLGEMSGCAQPRDRC